MRRIQSNPRIAFSSSHSYHLILILITLIEAILRDFARTSRTTHGLLINSPPDTAHQNYWKYVWRTLILKRWWPRVIKQGTSASSGSGCISRTCHYKTFSLNCCHRHDYWNVCFDGCVKIRAVSETMIIFLCLNKLLYEMIKGVHTKGLSLILREVRYTFSVWMYHCRWRKPSSPITKLACLETCRKT